MDFPLLHMRQLRKDGVSSCSSLECCQREFRGKDAMSERRRGCRIYAKRARQLEFGHSPMSMQPDGRLLACFGWRVARTRPHYERQSITNNRALS